MTQTLIQQLAARAGFTTPQDITPAECSGCGTTLLLFELCAHLDEQAKTQVLPRAEASITVIRPCPKCGKEGEADHEATTLGCPFCGYEWDVDAQQWPVKTQPPTLDMSRALVGEPKPLKPNFRVNRRTRPEITIQEDEPAASPPLICAEHGARIPADECVTCRVFGTLDDRDPCCWACTPDYRRMLLCRECGNKRCPRANDHRFLCTGSNELNQVGQLREPPVAPEVAEPQFDHGATIRGVDDFWARPENRAAPEVAAASASERYDRGKGGRAHDVRDELIAELRKSLSEAREALARADAQFSEQESSIARTTVQLEAVMAELAKVTAERDEMRSTVRRFETTCGKERPPPPVGPERPMTDRTLKLWDDDTYGVIAYDRQDVIRVLLEADMGEPDPECFDLVPMHRPVTISVVKGTNRIAAIDADPAGVEPRTRKASEWIQLEGRSLLFTREC